MVPPCGNRRAKPQSDSEECGKQWYTFVRNGTHSVRIRVDKEYAGPVGMLGSGVIAGGCGLESHKGTVLVGT